MPSGCFSGDLCDETTDQAAGECEHQGYQNLDLLWLNSISELMRDDQVASERPIHRTDRQSFSRSMKVEVDERATIVLLEILHKCGSLVFAGIETFGEVSESSKMWEEKWRASLFN